jgi:RNA polymerase sigma factor (TIGR02999 family)
MADVTLLLQQWRAGDREARNDLFELVLPDLRRLARYLLKGEGRDCSIQATELIDEIYFRLVNVKDRNWENRAHFIAFAGRCMRWHLTDRARRRPDGKVALEDVADTVLAGSAGLEEVVMVDRLLDELEKVKPEWCRLVEVKYFLGLTDQEAADALGLKLRTMQRMWVEARNWLFIRKEAGRAK